jgi:hypothetical protein
VRSNSRKISICTFLSKAFELLLVGVVGPISYRSFADKRKVKKNFKIARIGSQSVRWRIKLYFFKERVEGPGLFFSIPF